MSEQAGIRRPPGLKVTYRRMKFPFETTGFDRYWHGGSPFRSLFWTQLSTAFEPGEKFFIDSARALKGTVKDPALLEEMNEFCKQEGHHTAQHLKFDRMNAAKGIDIDGCRRRFTATLDRARSNMDPMEMLAATVALEHLTAALAEQQFARPDLSAGADPNVDALWVWHAAEETEHKATCYDIYQAAGGGYFRRAIIMPGAWFMIVAISLYNTMVLLHRDKKLFNFKDVFGGLWYLFGPRGMLTSLLPTFLEFFRPSFHPWKHDDSAVIEHWKANNSQYMEAPRASLRPAAKPAPLAIAV
jgi:hypothetical protein